MHRDISLLIQPKRTVLSKLCKCSFRKVYCELGSVGWVAYFCILPIPPPATCQISQHGMLTVPYFQTVLSDALRVTGEVNFLPWSVYFIWKWWEDHETWNQPQMGRIEWLHGISCHDTTWWSKQLKDQEVSMVEGIWHSSSKSYVQLYL